MSNLIITNALIIPMTDGRRSFNGYVGTKDGVITEIGTGAPPENKRRNESSTPPVACSCRD